MIAAPVQGDVDGITQRSHGVFLVLTWGMPDVANAMPEGQQGDVRALDAFFHEVRTEM